MTNKINTNELEQVSGGVSIGAAAKAGTYTVKAGDTLSGIAQKLKTSTEKLFMANRMTIINTAKKMGVKCAKEEDYANYIYVGTVLVVPMIHG